MMEQSLLTSITCVYSLDKIIHYFHCLIHVTRCYMDKMQCDILALRGYSLDKILVIHCFHCMIHVHVTTCSYTTFCPMSTCLIHGHACAQTCNQLLVMGLVSPFSLQEACSLLTLTLPVWQ